MKELKRAVIKEESVALTGDVAEEVLLNHLMVESVKQDEWIHKTAEELSRETLLCLSPRSIRTHLKRLITSGWIEERTDPQYRFDRTKQYKVNISKVQSNLQNKGYTLEGSM